MTRGWRSARSAPSRHDHVVCRLDVQNITVLVDCRPRHRHQADPSTLAIRCIDRNRLFKVLGAHYGVWCNDLVITPMESHEGAAARPRKAATGPHERES